MGEPDNRNHLRHRDDASHHQLQENLPIPSEHAGVTLSCGAGPEADHNGLPSAGRQTSCLTTAALLEDAGMSHKPIPHWDSSVTMAYPRNRCVESNSFPEELKAVKCDS